MSEQTERDLRAEVERLADVLAERNAVIARVEALADEWEGWARSRSTVRIDAFRDAAEKLRAALASPVESDAGGAS